MRHLVGFVPALPQPLGQSGELARSLLGQLLPCPARLKGLGIGERLLQPLAKGAINQVLRGELVHLLHRVGEVGVDADAVHVGHDQQWGVFQRDAVLQELRERGFQVFATAFVFPREMALAPDVCPAVAATRLAGALFEGEPLPRGISRNRINHAEQFAQVIEMALGGGPLLEFNVAPFRQKLVGAHQLPSWHCYLQTGTSKLKAWMKRTRRLTRSFSTMPVGPSRWLASRLIPD
jgi:hypothetical protein